MKRVAIVGKGPGWQVAPISAEDGDKEVWVVNDGFMNINHPNPVVYEMHGFDWTLEECYRHQKLTVGHVHDDQLLWKKANNKWKYFPVKTQVINDRGLKLISIKKYNHIPTSEAFPLEEIVQEYCQGRYYFTCGISYMIAHAIWLGYTHVDIYGCNMDSQGEYQYQRDNVHWWIGLAMGKGIQVTVTGTHSRPMTSHNGLVYGYMEEMKSRPAYAVSMDQFPSFKEVNEQVRDKVKKTLKKMGSREKVA